MGALYGLRPEPVPARMTMWLLFGGCQVESVASYRSARFRVVFVPHTEPSGPRKGLMRAFRASSGFCQAFVSYQRTPAPWLWRAGTRRVRTRFQSTPA